MLSDKPVQPVHPDRPPLACGLAFAGTRRAGVVAVNDPVLGSAGPQGHPAPAGGAHRQPRQQDGPSSNPWRNHARTAGVELALNLFKNLRIHQAGNRDRDDFLIGLALTSARRPNIELPLADIDGVCQDMVYRANSKGHATPGAIAITIEPFDDFLDAECARDAIAV